jgi:hypothetical protein
LELVNYLKAIAWLVFTIDMNFQKGDGSRFGWNFTLLWLFNVLPPSLVVSWRLSTKWWNFVALFSSMQFKTFFFFWG